MRRRCRPSDGQGVRQPLIFFFSSRRRHTRWTGDWSSDVCSSDLCSLYELSFVLRTVNLGSEMTGSSHTNVGRTQVGIVGAGPAGLLLSHLLALRGIDSVVVEIRSRAYCEARQRAGVLEDGTVKLLRESGLAGRLDREGLEHGGIYLQFAGERHHLDFRDLAGGRTVTVYAQTEVVKDLIGRRIADGGALELEVCDTAVTGLDTDEPVLSYTASDGQRHEITCDVIAGCDGFHGICRPAIPDRLRTVWERDYPYAWLG